MERYWSLRQMLQNTPVKTVEATKLKQRRMNFMMSFVMLAIMPLLTMTPPKHMAQIISQMVFIMPPMPRVATSSVSIGLEVLICVLP